VPSVRVSLADAVERRLPLVSVRSGRPADGYVGVPLGLGFVERLLFGVTQRSIGRPVAQLPLTEHEFDRVMRLRRVERSGLVNTVVFGTLGLALARFPLLLPLGLVIVVSSLLLVGVARFGLARVIPELSANGGVVTIDGAHAGFVTSVERGGRRYS
jgi:hypothetical protein